MRSALHPRKDDAAKGVPPNASIPSEPKLHQGAPIEASRTATPSDQSIGLQPEEAHDTHELARRGMAGKAREYSVTTLIIYKLCTITVYMLTRILLYLL